MSVSLVGTLDRNTTVLTKMTKSQAADLVRFLTLAICETETDSIDLRVDITKDFDGQNLLVSAANNTLFGSRAVIETVITSEVK